MTRKRKKALDRRGVQLYVPEGGGPPTAYLNKLDPPFTIKLTQEARDEFDRLREVTGLSGSDVVEMLVRRFGRRLEELYVVPAETAATAAAAAEGR